MTVTLAEHSALPFHLGLTEPIDETDMADHPAVEGSYDPVEQIWKLPAGTLPPTPFTFTHCLIHGTEILDDGQVD
jgi:hypothetical protein